MTHASAPRPRPTAPPPSWPPPLPAADRAGSTARPADDARSIVLTGFMGTGKTTVGRVLAERLGYELVDTDRVLTERYGAIPEIFAARGEAGFRALERILAAELADRPGLVISTGGGFMLDDGTAATLAPGAAVVWLTATADTIIARLRGDGGLAERPLLADAPDPAARVAELLAERHERYAQFLPVTTDDRTPEQVADAVVALFRPAGEQVPAVVDPDPGPAPTGGPGPVPDPRQTGDDPGPTGWRAAALGLVRRFDDTVDRLVAPLRGHRTTDWVAYAASESADYSKLWHAIGIAMAVVSPRRRPHALRLAVALGVESILVNGVIKQFIRRERPPLLEDRTYEVRRPRTQSFPSGHASSATLAASLLSDAAPSLRPLWVATAATVATSRIHNRMHHASDVVAGALLGWLFAAAVRRVWPLRDR
ncbi:MAG: shikimate kinase [Acidimicrobiales bacterium]